jgi:hypothetical protein
MHYARFTDLMGISIMMAQAFQFACNIIIKDGPRDRKPESAYDVFNWYRTGDEDRQEHLLATIATARSTQTNDSRADIPCWQLTALGPNDEAVRQLTGTAPPNEVLVAIFMTWVEKLELATPGLVPIQHRGSLALLAFVRGAADDFHVEIYDNSTETEKDLQLRAVFKYEGEYHMLTIEPNPYTDPGAKRLRDRHN